LGEPFELVNQTKPNHKILWNVQSFNLEFELNQTIFRNTSLVLYSNLVDPQQAKPSKQLYDMKAFAELQMLSEKERWHYLLRRNFS
jgi:hypothetical protein